MDEKEGHRMLASLCVDELDNLKQRGVREAQFSSSEKYALLHGVRHMMQLDEDITPSNLEECIQKYVIDVEIVYSKLFMSYSTSAEDILWLQKQEMSILLSENSKCFLEWLLFLLKKHCVLLEKHPFLLFQTLLIEGGTMFSSLALSCLKTKYPDVTYLECVQKGTWRSVMYASFYCSSHVACFDVSPNLDYIVCECKSGELQLWSLNAGRVLWIRPVRVSKDYIFGSGAFRRSRSSSAWSFYRSVVFHPTEDVILPGTLSHVYNFDGDLKLLFPKSSCCFKVCSVSRDKATMLTDSPDDAKCIIMWNLKNGSEITRIVRDEEVLSFAWSQDGKLIAISHSSGLICLIDVKDGFRTVAQNAASQVYGMIKFTPDNRFLLCANLCSQQLLCVNTNVGNHGTLSLDVPSAEAYDPWKCESLSDGGFLLGDPLTPFVLTVETPNSGTRLFGFRINESTLLRSNPRCSHIAMCDVNALLETTKLNVLVDVAFSLDGETLYCVTTGGGDNGKLVACNVLNGELIAEKLTSYKISDCLVAVKEGVLFLTCKGVPELWNFNLSLCIRSWPSLYQITQMILISEEVVACVQEGAEVNFLNTSNGEIEATIPILHGEFVSCNSKYQLITVGDSSVQVLVGTTLLWKTGFAWCHPVHGHFSPSEELLILFEHGCNQGAHVLSTVSGNPLCTLCSGDTIWDCKFVNEEECVIYSYSGHFYSWFSLQLFNVKSGDLLTLILIDNGWSKLVVCPPKDLIAACMDVRDSEVNFLLLQVKRPQDKGNRTSKR